MLTPILTSGTFIACKAKEKMNSFFNTYGFIPVGVFVSEKVSVSADSGGLLSCVGGIIVRNCYTNNVMYGNSQTGTFTGRIFWVGKTSAGRFFDDDNTQTIGTYFENCYASGAVEGTDKIGVFSGFIQVLNANHTTLFKNCYSTAMVGMDYAGTDLSGFIGCDETSINTSTNLEIGGQVIKTNGDAFINCYAAGEVGNILTETNPQNIAFSDNTKTRLGGFIGSIHRSTNPAPTAYFNNCYYDMQTTGMRERGYGMSATLEGIAGGYTVLVLHKRK